MQGHLDGSSFPQTVDCDVCGGSGRLYTPDRPSRSRTNSRRPPTGITEIESLLAKILIVCIFGGAFGLCLGQTTLHPIGALILGGLAAFVSAKLLFGPLRGLLKLVKFLLAAAIVIVVLAVIAKA